MYPFIEHSGNTIRLSKVFHNIVKMKTFTVSVAVILLFTIPQDGNAEPLFFGFLSKLFGGGKGKGNSGGRFVISCNEHRKYIKFFKIIDW